MEVLELDRDKSDVQHFADLDEFIEQQEAKLNARSLPVNNSRDSINGDNNHTLTNTHYGNGDVQSGTPVHGSHVAGIIGAIRGNGVGMDGVADHVEIMTLRVVPQGDEYDKDVALGIRYAVDNGAKVINMSFGKELSPDKNFVDDAIRYAASHDVLIVHAAGNDSWNMDTIPNYPSNILNDGTIANNIITVGASGDSSLNTGLVADFTNYGKLTVDVMAPGVKIYSTVPHNKEYSYQQGTSMAAPVVSGVAALLRSYFPRLTAVQVKQVIENSVDNSMQDKKFPLPGGDKKEMVRMRELCKTGGIVNAYNAVLLAEKMQANTIMR